VGRQVERLQSELVEARAAAGPREYRAEASSGRAAGVGVVVITHDDHGYMPAIRWAFARSRQDLRAVQSATRYDSPWVDASNLHHAIEKLGR